MQRLPTVAQRFGADDLDGTVVEEKIYHEAGSTESQSLRRGELLRLSSPRRLDLKAVAGKVNVQRAGPRIVAFDHHFGR